MAKHEFSQHNQDALQSSQHDMHILASLDAGRHSCLCSLSFCLYCVTLCVCEYVLCVCGLGRMWWMTVQRRGVLTLIVMSVCVCGNPTGEWWQTGVCWRVSTSIALCVCVTSLYIQCTRGNHIDELWRDDAGAGGASALSGPSGDMFEKLAETKPQHFHNIPQRCGNGQERQVSDLLNSVDLSRHGEKVHFNTWRNVMLIH